MERNKYHSHLLYPSLFMAHRCQGPKCAGYNQQFCAATKVALNEMGLLFHIEVPTANSGLYFRLPQGARPRPKRKTRGDESQ